MEYTKGEWKVIGHKGEYGIVDTAESITIAEVYGNDKANAQRIVDCVNGCKDIENPLAIKDLYEACRLAFSYLLNRPAKTKQMVDITDCLEKVITKAEGK